MGLFDSIKSAFGNKAEEADTTIGPSQLLRDAGINPDGLNFGFGADSVTVSGDITDEADRKKILDVLATLPGISSVQDNMYFAAPAPAEPEAPEAAAPVVEEPPVTETESKAGAEADVYTVQSGDTLWKIAQQAYGDGSKYMKIFEANTDVLKDPDHIYPGQELKIPAPD